jgi:hypothetical protein
MPVKLRIPKRRSVQTISEPLMREFCDQAAVFEPGEAPEDYVNVMYLSDLLPFAKECWEAARDDVIAWCSKNTPGRRSSWWWRLEGHRRERLGGIGSSMLELNPDYPGGLHGPWDCGVPEDWVSEREVEFWRGRVAAAGGAPDIVTAVDPAFQPLFESQAAFLKRNGLLGSGELKRLSPADFEPEAVVLE